MNIPADPMEKIIAVALDTAGISHTKSAVDLDFYLPEFDVHIECKRFHSPRISQQMERADNVIVLQGEKAVKTFAAMLIAARQSKQD